MYHGDIERRKRMSKVALKPCPFCGGKAMVIETYCKETDFRGYFVNHSCRVFFDPLRTSSYNTDDEAIKAWNERFKDGEWT